MVTLSAAAIKAQQALSEKYGIPTFDLSGKVSTIPLTRAITNINVGTGSTGLTSQGLMDYLKKITPAKALVPTSPVQLSSGKIIDIPTSSKLVEGETALSLRDISPTWQTSIQQYIPFIVLGGIGLIALTLLRR